jgi:CRISPR-associated protein Csx10
MTQLLITIKTLSPLYAGAQKPYGSFLETLQEVPGALLRGALTHETLPNCTMPEFKYNHEACEVKDTCPFYYLITGVVFPTCAIAEGERRTEPPLRTMVTCKAVPGFTTEPDHKQSDQRHGVFDTLLAHLAFSELQAKGISPFKLPPMQCEKCGALLEPASTRYVRERAGRYHSAPPVITRRMTHVAINRRLETAERGLLYAIQSISEGVTFAGRITLPDSWDEKRVEEFKSLLTSISRLGGEQTYGLGRVKVTVREAEGDTEDMPARIDRFNEKLKEVWSEYSSRDTFLAPDGHYFTIDLLTPALLTAPDGTPTVRLTREMLKERAAELGYPHLPDLEEVGCFDGGGKKRPLMFSAPLVVSGWSEAWGLPKPTAMAAAAGSVYTFRSQDIGAWYDALTTIEAHGIGARCEEGFGAVCVCHPFHQEVSPV